MKKWKHPSLSATEGVDPAAGEHGTMRRRLRSWIFGNDRLQEIRIRRTLLGTVSYFTYLPALALAVHLGWIRGGWPVVAGLLVLALVANALFYTLIRSGLSRSLGFADPSLTAPQIATASLLILLLLATLRQGTDLFLSLYFASFFFGVFRLDRGAYLRLALFAILAFLVFFFWRLNAAGYPPAAAERDGLRLIILVTLLVWISLMGSYVSALRERASRDRSELKRALATVRELSVRDELTGLWNRRHLREILEREVARLDRRGNKEMHDLSLAVLDIDNFKTINDTYGHGVGDEVLKAVAARLESALRRQDWIAHPEDGESPDAGEASAVRFGGDEFVLVLPETGHDGARACLERVFEAAIGKPVSTSAGPVDVRLSIGVATRREGETPAVLLTRADRLLYRAKSSGRGCFLTDDGEDPGTEGTTPL